MIVDYRCNLVSVSIEIENNFVESCFNVGFKNVCGSVSGIFFI